MMKTKIIGTIIIFSVLFSCKVAKTGHYKTVDRYSQTKGFNLTLNLDNTYFFKDTNSGMFSEGTYKIINDKVIFFTLPYKKINISITSLENNQIHSDSILIILNNVYQYQAFRFGESSFIFISDSTCSFKGDSCYLQKPKGISYIQLYSARPDLVSNKVMVDPKKNMFLINNSTHLNLNEKFIPLNGNGVNCYEDKYEYLIKKESCICSDTMYIISKNKMQYGAIKYRKYD